MTLDLTAEQEAILLEIAHKTGKSPEQVLIEAAVRLQTVAEDEKREQTPTAHASDAERAGDWASSEEMDARVEKMLFRR